MIPVIGLEIHIQLKTRTKMFCDCLNDPEEKHPNINVCPICLAHPGTLPTINQRAVELVLKLGKALNGEILKIAKFDRKNYFYPDLPKGYQISQYDKPLVKNAFLDLGNKKINIRRIHLEEDTGKLTHFKKDTLVDFNRASIPLMELVTEPEIENGEQAKEFAKKLQLILRYLDISDADMEKGQMRIEANVSISKDGDLSGTKVEVKNLNSFKSVEEAINYEIKRQTELLKKGEKIIQETRGFNEEKRITVSQREKEEAHDYRYFKEPDLFYLNIEKFDLEKIFQEIPELPDEKNNRFQKEYYLLKEEAQLLVEDKTLADYFEKSISELKLEINNNIDKGIKLLYNYLISDLKGLLKEKNLNIKDLNISEKNFAKLIALILKNTINSRIAKDVLKEMVLTGKNPEQIIEEKNLSQVSDDSLLKNIAQEVIDENPQPVNDFKSGKESALQFLIGQAMKKLKGRANPKSLSEILKELLK